jgi:cytochrome c oxidase subunit 2
VVHAPSLAGVYGKEVPLNSGELVRADDQYIRDSILLPGKQISAGYDNVMPSFTGHISEAEIMQIIAYLRSIGDQPPEAK